LVVQQDRFADGVDWHMIEVRVMRAFDMSVAQEPYRIEDVERLNRSARIPCVDAMVAPYMGVAETVFDDVSRIAEVLDFSDRISRMVCLLRGT
jgi:hypothetical protein